MAGYGRCSGIVGDNRNKGNKTDDHGSLVVGPTQAHIVFLLVPGNADDKTNYRDPVNEFIVHSFGIPLKLRK
jgi:hypothetical protein